VTVAVTGAVGQIAYGLLFRIASAAMLGAQTPVRLRLLEIPAVVASLEGVAMELEDGAFPLLDSVDISDDPWVGFEGANVALLVGARPRTAGMERSDLLNANGPQPHRPRARVTRAVPRRGTGDRRRDDGRVQWRRPRRPASDLRCAGRSARATELAGLETDSEKGQDHSISRWSRFPGR
jgi:hypothetical protein